MNIAHWRPQFITTCVMRPATAKKLCNAVPEVFVSVPVSDHCLQMRKNVVELFVLPDMQYVSSMRPHLSSCLPWQRARQKPGRVPFMTTLPLRQYFSRGWLLIAVIGQLLSACVTNKQLPPPIIMPANVLLVVAFRNCFDRSNCYWPFSLPKCCWHH